MELLLIHLRSTDWADEETDLATGAASTGTAAGGHLWEESWDDDDTSDDFAQMLK